MYTQTNPLWANDDMGMPGDKLWRWGCLITCIANILSELKKIDITPKQLNKLLRQNKGYNILQNPNCNINVASNLVWESLINLFNIKIILSVNKADYIKNNTSFYIAKIIHSLTNSGHYINVLDRVGYNWKCFDVEDGKEKMYTNQQIKNLTKIYI